MSSTSTTLPVILEIVNDIEKHENELAIEKIKADITTLIYQVDSCLGWSLLVHAIHHDNQTVIDFLLDHMNHDVSSTRYRETSIIFCVGIQKSEMTLRKLVAKFPETINETDINGNCALLHTIADDEYEKAEILLEAGADMYRTNFKGETLLDLVIAYDDPKMIALFNKYQK